MPNIPTIIACLMLTVNTLLLAIITLRVTEGRNDADTFLLLLTMCVPACWLPLAIGAFIAFRKEVRDRVSLWSGLTVFILSLLVLAAGAAVFFLYILGKALTVTV